MNSKSRLDFEVKLANMPLVAGGERGLKENVLNYAIWHPTKIVVRKPFAVLPLGCDLGEPLATFVVGQSNKAHALVTF
ncbi:hypothetical protein NPIL_256641 [Nephila pilipes]|uniref:Uncharacterized protein n=1 Tax=Nephila pilipes TaxID=299642 RepID=A0A8X6QK35_NEPPI|nr:hypothetical protein NPIL_256641 [Nephila pilipes]